jgi:hypothetical protein
VEEKDEEEGFEILRRRISFQCDVGDVSSHTFYPSQSSHIIVGSDFQNSHIIINFINKNSEGFVYTTVVRSTFEGRTVN